MQYQFSFLILGNIVFTAPIQSKLNRRKANPEAFFFLIIHFVSSMAGVYSRDERHEKDLRNTVRTDALAISLYFWGRKNSSPDRPYRPSLADVPNRPSLGGGLL